MIALTENVQAEGSKRLPREITVFSSESSSNVYISVDAFVAHVLHDGRFVDSFTINPAAVADQLGITVAPDVLFAIQGCDRIKLLAEVTERMTFKYGQGAPGDAPLPNTTAGLIFIAVPVVIAILVIVQICTDSSPSVIDCSANKDSKL